MERACSDGSTSVCAQGRSPIVMLDLLVGYRRGRSHPGDVTSQTKIGIWRVLAVDETCWAAADTVRPGGGSHGDPPKSTSRRRRWIRSFACQRPECRYADWPPITMHPLPCDSAQRCSGCTGSPSNGPALLRVALALREAKQRGRCLWAPPGQPWAGMSGYRRFPPFLALVEHGTCRGSSPGYARDVVIRSSIRPSQALGIANTAVHSSNGRLEVTRVEPAS